MLKNSKNVAGLFRGKKPRSLWGGATKQERTEYKSRLGMRGKRSIGKVSNIEAFLPQLIPYQKLVESVLNGRIDKKTIKFLKQETTRLVKLRGSVLSGNRVAREDLLWNFTAHRSGDILTIGSDVIEGLQKNRLTKYRIEVCKKRLKDKKISGKYLRETSRKPFLVFQTKLQNNLKNSILFQSNIAKRKNIKLTLIKNPETEVMIAVTPVFDIVEELIQNSIHHTPEGGTINVSGRSDRQRTIITVEDTGKGMTPKQLADLRRGKRFTTRPKGTGTGLFIIRETLKIIGGTMDIESELGKGTKITITLT